MPKQHIKRYNFRRADYQLINQDLDEIEWDSILGSQSAESSVDVFYNYLYGIIKDRVPLSRQKSPDFPVWFSKSLILIFKYKKKAWRKWKNYKKLSDYEKFSSYRARFKVECNKCYQRTWPEIV